MIRTARVMAWLRWRLLLNLLRPTKKRDTLERASRALQALGPIFLALLMVPAVLLTAAIGGAAGYLLPREGNFHQNVLVVIRIWLAFGMLLAVLAPFLRMAHGSTPNLTRFLLLPIPVKVLYASEALGALVDPWLLILGSGSLTLSAGMALSRGAAAGAVTFLGALGILSLLSGLGALATSLAHLIFRNRRRGEIASLILLGFVALAGMVPAFFTSQAQRLEERHRRTKAEREDRPRSAEPRPETRGWSKESSPAWARAYPPELYVQTVARSADLGAGAALAPLAGLLLTAGLIHAVGAGVYRRLLETPEVQSPRRAGAGRAVRWERIPGLSPAASAVAQATVRLVHRTVQGKLSLFLMPVVVLVMGVVGRTLPKEGPLATGMFSEGVALATLGTLFALLSLESATLNQFAMDRAGLTLSFLAPISDRDLVIGKAAGGALLAASRGIPCVAVAVLVAPGGSLFLWLAVLVAGAAAFVGLAPCGTLMSAVLPKSMDIGKIGQAGKPHPIASMLGMLVLLSVLGPSAGLSVLGLLVFKSPLIAFLLVLAWAGVVTLVSVLLFRVAVRVVGRRRENLALVCQGR